MAKFDKEFKQQAVEYVKSLYFHIKILGLFLLMSLSKVFLNLWIFLSRLKWGKNFKNIEL